MRPFDRSLKWHIENYLEMPLYAWLDGACQEVYERAHMRGADPTNSAIEFFGHIFAARDIAVAMLRTWRCETFGHKTDSDGFCDACGSMAFDRKAF